MASAQRLRRALLLPLVTILIIAGALVASAVPAQAASWRGHTWVGFNWAGYFAFSDLNQGSGTISDYNKFALTDYNDRYSHTVRVYDKYGSLRLNKYVSNNTTMNAGIYLRKGSFRTVYCIYITGGNLVSCETLYLYNN